jgi:hypothetical protein
LRARCRGATLIVTMKIFVRRQMSVALRNEPGQLARVCQLLADNLINIDAIHVLDNVEQGMIRLLTSNATLSRSVLEKNGFYVLEAELLEVEVANEPGALAQVTTRLAAAGVNIDYAYGTESPSGDSMRVCFKVADALAAGRLLRDADASA